MAYSVDRGLDRPRARGSVGAALALAAAAALFLAHAARGAELGSGPAAPATDLGRAPPRPAVPDTLDWTPPDELASRVRAAIGARWGSAPGAIRLAWEAPAAGGLPPGALDELRLLGPGRGGTWLVVVGGPAARASLRVRAGTEVVRPFARTDLPRGRTLGEADVEWRPAIAWGPDPGRTAAAEPGWVTRRAIRGGEPLLPPAVAPPILVRAGAEVEVSWRRGGLELRVPGRAMSGAALGEAVTVRLSSGVRLRGIASAPAEVTVQGGG